MKRKQHNTNDNERYATASAPKRMINSKIMSPYDQRVIRYLYYKNEYVTIYY